MDNSKNHKAILVASLKKGNPVAFRKIFDSYQKQLFHFIFSLVKSDYASEDILQEVFVRIWNQRENLDVSCSFDSYIYTIAKNLAYNHLRNVANQETLRKELWRNLSYGQQCTEDIILSEEYEDIVNDILENISPKKRSVFILSKQQGKSNNEIAKLLGISPKTVKNHLWKTLQLIREQLEPHLKD